MRNIIPFDLFYNNKLIGLAFSLAVFASCSSTKNKPTANFKLDDVRYIIQDGSVAYPVTNDNILDSSDGSYFMVDLQITNQSKERLLFDSSNFKLTDNTGKSFPISEKGEEFMRHFKEVAHKTNIAPDSTKDCVLLYNVSSNSKYQLHVTSPKTGITKTIHF